MPLSFISHLPALKSRLAGTCNGAAICARSTPELFEPNVVEIEDASPIAVSDERNCRQGGISGVISKLAVRPGLAPMFAQG